MQWRNVPRTCSFLMHIQSAILPRTVNSIDRKACAGAQIRVASSKTSVERGYSTTASGLLAPSMASDNEGDFFYYFAYGSNLLKERLLMANPSARFHCRGRLKGYSLKFGNFQGITSKTWHGGFATIREAPGDEVWGVVWKMSTSDLQSLDRQECSYSPLLANVETENGELPCRTYQMNNYVDKCPSPQYKYVIVLGAKQNGLPEFYIKRLEAIEVNDNKEPTILEDIPIGVC